MRYYTISACTVKFSARYPGADIDLEVPAGTEVMPVDCGKAGTRYAIVDPIPLFPRTASKEAVSSCYNHVFIDESCGVLSQGE